MAKRYGQRPSRLLPRGTFRSDEERLYFDMNVMLAGMVAERRAQDEAMTKGKSGFTTTRQGAMALARRARLMAEQGFQD